MTTQQQTWSLGSWKWDPYKLVAAPAGGSTFSTKTQDATGETSTSGSDEHAELASSKRNCRSDGPVMCQVDGCLTDLAGLKEYHNRYRICQYHLKIPCIVREGNRQRFCQQCGRFHNIGEFDGDKRSCRARLERHNARRRKKGEGEITKVVRKHPKTERNSASLGSAPSPVHGAASDGHVTGNSDSLPNSPQDSQKLQPPLAQLTDDKLPPEWHDIDTSAGLALDHAFSEFLAQENGYASQNNLSMEDLVPSMSHDDLTLTKEIVMEDMFGQSQMSNTAPFTSSMNELPDAMPLNMLPGSSTAFHPYMQPSQYQSGSNLGPDTMSPMYLMQQQALLSARQQGYHEGIRNQQRRQQLQEQAQQAQHAQQQHSMQQHSTQAHSAPQLQLPAQAQHHLPQPPQPQHDPSGWCQALDPLPSASYSFNNMDMSMSDVLMQAVQPAADKAVSAPQQKQWLIGSEQPQQHLQAYSGASLPEHPTTTAPQHAQQHTAEQAGSQSQPSSMSVLAEAKDILSFHHTQPQYIADEQFVRMSAKLFNCTPAHLPHDLKQNLMGLLSCGVNSIEGYIMPGCVQLTLNALISSDKYQSVQAMGVRQAFEVLMQQGNNRAFWGTDTMLMQWQDAVALIRNGKIQHVLSGIGSLGVLPQMHSVSPLCISNRGTSTLKVSGFNIAKQGCSVLCRHQGSYVPIRVTVEHAGAAGGQQQVKVHLPAGLPRGALQLEVICGGFISPSQAVLVLDSREAVAELAQLHFLPVPGLDIDSLMTDFGQVLEYSTSKQIQMTGQQIPTREWAPADEFAIAATACRLLSFACQVGWTAVSEILLAVCPITGQTISELVAELDRLSDSGLTLLHHAVRSRSASLVEMLCIWGVNNKYDWDYAAAGPCGLTPLHLAAVLGDGGKVASQLTDAYPGALSGWASVKAQDGSTAADLASMTGGENINISMVHKLAGNSPDESAFHFHPETGELLEDDEAEMASDTAQDIPGSEGSKVTQSQPGHHLPTITHATPTVQVDTASVAEEPSSPNLKPWSSTGADNLEVESKVHEYAGLHYRSKGFTSHRSMYEEDMFLERKGQCLKAPPSMFDSQAAVLSSVVIGIVACLALGLRYCLD